MTKTAHHEMHVLRTQPLGNVMDLLTGSLGDRFRALAWEIAEALAEHRAKNPGSGWGQKEAQE